MRAPGRVRAKRYALWSRGEATLRALSSPALAGARRMRAAEAPFAFFPARLKPRRALPTPPFLVTDISVAGPGRFALERVPLWRTYLRWRKLMNWFWKQSL